MDGGNQARVWVLGKQRTVLGGAGEAELSWYRLFSKGGSLHLRLQPPQPFSGKPGTARAAEKIRLLHLLMN